MQDALSFFVQSYKEIAAWSAVVELPVAADLTAEYDPLMRDEGARHHRRW